MRVLVTGGTGVVGAPAVRELVARGHTVRLLSRHADRDVAQFAGTVEAHAGSITDPDTVRGAADGCDAVLHIAGIARESPPDATFERVNVEGTRRLLAEAERAAVPRFLFVSSLGAGDGRSDYHRSKRRAEELVQRFRGDWLVLRPGNVYGPGDEVLSQLLTMVRALPVMPVLGRGDDPFQPVDADDLGRALATAVERGDLAGRVLLLAGPEVTTTNDLLDRLARITGRSPTRIPVPTGLAALGAQLAEAVGATPPVTDDQIIMLTEHNVIPAGEANALIEVLGVTPTPLDEGLGRLADSQPEQLPSEGVGRLFHRRYWADIAGSGHDARSLFALFRTHFATLAPESMSVGAEPASSQALLVGETITMTLGPRGHIQVRVEEVGPTHVTLVTLEGHPLAGAVQFRTEPVSAGVRFEVRTWDRAADPVDLAVMSTVGRWLKHENWRRLVTAVAERCGGEVPAGVQRETEVLEGERAEAVERWLDELVLARRRAEERDALRRRGADATPEGEVSPPGP